VRGIIRGVLGAGGNEVDVVGTVGVDVHMMQRLVAGWAPWESCGTLVTHLWQKTP
jgi:hypothetical protein